MRSLRAAALLVAIVLLPVPVFADVTMKMTMATTGGPASVEMTSVTFIKGMKMRSDINVTGQDMSVFLDVAAKRQVMVNNLTKEVTDLGTALENTPVNLGEVAASVNPNGQTKVVLGRTCAGYAVEYSMPMTMMGETITMVVSGVAWVAKDAPGAAEYMAFSKAAAAAGLTTATVAQGPQARGFASLQTALTENGIPLEQEMQLKITGTGQMAQAMAQSGVGATTITVKVTEISIDLIPADTIAMPAAVTKK
jgi:hypothetical protein